MVQQNNSLKENKQFTDKNFIVVDKNFMIKLNEVKAFIKEECGDTMTFNELMHKIREYLDEEKFAGWLDNLKAVKKVDKLSLQSKQKILKILKGGK